MTRVYVVQPRSIPFRPLVSLLFLPLVENRESLVLTAEKIALYFSLFLCPDILRYQVTDLMTTISYAHLAEFEYGKYLIVPFWDASVAHGHFGSTTTRNKIRTMDRPNSPDMPLKRIKKVRLGITNISNTRDSVSSKYSNIEKSVENTTRSGVFLTKFEVFRQPMKQCPECLIYLLN